jgi:hypothetical protein
MEGGGGSVPDARAAEPHVLFPSGNERGAGTCDSKLTGDQDLGTTQRDMHSSPAARVRQSVYLTWLRKVIEKYGKRTCQAEPVPAELNARKQCGHRYLERHQ